MPNFARLEGKQRGVTMKTGISQCVTPFMDVREGSMENGRKWIEDEGNDIDDRIG
jgi:hypothetical protein